MSPSAAFDTDRPVEQRPLAAIALRLLTALLLAVMFALVKLAATRGVHLIEILFYRQVGSALCAVGLVAAGPGFASLRTKRVGAHVLRMGLGMTAMALNFLAMIMLPLAEATAIGFLSPFSRRSSRPWCSQSRQGAGAGARSRRASSECW